MQGNRLEGVWKSNKEKTLASFEIPQQASESLRERFADLFGKLVVIYRGNESVSIASEKGKNGAEYLDVQKASFNVQIETPTKTLIEFVDHETREKETVVLNFVDDKCYWISLRSEEFGLGFLDEGKEYFDRIDL